MTLDIISGLFGSLADCDALDSVGSAVQRDVVLKVATWCAIVPSADNRHSPAERWPHHQQQICHSSQDMYVFGCDAMWRKHKHWQDNTHFGLYMDGQSVRWSTLIKSVRAPIPSSFRENEMRSPSGWSLLHIFRKHSADDAFNFFFQGS